MPSGNRRVTALVSVPKPEPIPESEWRLKANRLMQKIAEFESDSSDELA